MQLKTKETQIGNKYATDIFKEMQNSYIKVLGRLHTKNYMVLIHLFST